MKTRTIILIALCVLAVIALILFLATPLISAPGVGGSAFAAIVGGLLLFVVVSAPALDEAVNSDPRPRGPIYFALAIIILVVILAALLTALF